MEVSAGIVIKYNDKILLAHPTKQDDVSWTIPKGKKEPGESLIDTAVREVKEEIGIDIDPDRLTFSKEIIYRNYKNKAYKRLHWFLLEIYDLSEINISTETLPKNYLQPREIDEARFMTFEEADAKIFWRQKEILQEIR